jgi:hypothetical protein
LEGQLPEASDDPPVRKARNANSSRTTPARIMIADDLSAGGELAHSPFQGHIGHSIELAPIFSTGTHPSRTRHASWQGRRPHRGGGDRPEIAVSDPIRVQGINLSILS